MTRPARVLEDRLRCQPLRDSFGEASAEYQQCLQNNRSGSGVRTGGGSYGGFSSGGGGHK